jgi:hypothetical protein
MAKAAKFQVQLSGEWKDYHEGEDKILKRAYLAGFPNAKYTLRGQQYAVDFKKMEQKNLKSGKSRVIRPPYKWKPPEAPIVEAGPTTCIKVPPGAPGSTIQVPHPKDKSQFIAVAVPPTAKVGQAMLVPVPPLTASAPEPSAPAPSAPCAPAESPNPTGVILQDGDKKKGWSTGAKVAAGVAGAAAVGGLVVGGAILGEHIAEEGWDATMEDLGDWFEGAGETIADGAEDAVEWVGDAADTAGDFIMDLF